MIAKVVSLSHKIRCTCLQTFDEINGSCVLEKKSTFKVTHTKTFKFESHKQWTIFMKTLQNFNFICSIFLIVTYTNGSNRVFYNV
jgi:hypothetical protein